MSRYSLAGTPIYRPDTASVVSHDRRQMQNIEETRVSEADVATELHTTCRAASSSDRAEFDIIPMTVTSAGKLCPHLATKAMRMRDLQAGRQSQKISIRARYSRMSMRSDIGARDEDCWKCRIEDTFNKCMRRAAIVCRCHTGLEDDDGESRAPRAVDV